MNKMNYLYLYLYIINAEPEWASINLGILICIECSGIHRKLGTHISKVRSTTLDSFDKELIQLMLHTGNSFSNSIFQFKFPDPSNPPEEFSSIKPPDSSSPRPQREEWIIIKYQQKTFLKPLPPFPPSSVCSFLSSLPLPSPFLPPPPPPPLLFSFFLSLSPLSLPSLLLLFVPFSLPSLSLHLPSPSLPSFFCLFLSLFPPFLSLPLPSFFCLFLSLLFSFPFPFPFPLPPFPPSSVCSFLSYFPSFSPFPSLLFVPFSLIFHLLPLPFLFPGHSLLKLWNSFPNDSS